MPEYRSTGGKAEGVRGCGGARGAGGPVKTLEWGVGWACGRAGGGFGGANALFERTFTPYAAACAPYVVACAPDAVACAPDAAVRAPYAGVQVIFSATQGTCAGVQATDRGVNPPKSTSVSLSTTPLPPTHPRARVPCLRYFVSSVLRYCSAVLRYFPSYNSPFWPASYRPMFGGSLAARLLHLAISLLVLRGWRFGVCWRQTKEST